MGHWRNLVHTLGAAGFANGHIVDADPDTQRLAFAELIGAGWVPSDAQMSDDVTAVLARGLPIRMSFWSQSELGCGVDFEVGIDLVQNERSWARVAAFMSRLATATRKSVVLGPEGSGPDDMTLITDPADGIVRLCGHGDRKLGQSAESSTEPDGWDSPLYFLDLLGHFATPREIKNTFWPGAPHDPNDPDPPFSDRDPRDIP